MVNKKNILFNYLKN